MTGPRMTILVSTLKSLPDIVTPNRSSPRGAGPPFFSPTRLYCDPWQGHSNHCDDSQNGTRQPRCTHFWYSATKPAAIPVRIELEYTFWALGSASIGYSTSHVRASAR